MAHKKNNKKITLHKYQLPAFRKIVATLERSARALMVMATGLGKTIVTMFVLKYFLKPGDTVLFVCHENGILMQTYKKFKKLFGNNWTYAKFFGKKKTKNADQCNFVFATFQSILSNLESNNGNVFSSEHFKYLVVDESHHSQAETFAFVLNYFKPIWKLGITATPDREDNIDIREIFGKEVVNYSLPEAIAKGWLTPVDYRVLSDGINEEIIASICKEAFEDNVRLTERQINEKIFIEARTEEQCKEIEKESATGKQAIVFCRNIEHLNHVASILPSSVKVHSKQGATKNHKALEAFEQRKARHILVVDKFNEGIDIPDTELIVFLRNTDSRRIFLQQLGRGLRLHEGKEKVVVLDFVGNVGRLEEIYHLTKEIEIHAHKALMPKFGETLPEEALHVEGRGFTFNFSKQAINLLSVLERNKQERYASWQEASAAAKKLGIKTRFEYEKRYKEDPRLLAKPQDSYSDFPGFPVFLGTGKKKLTMRKGSDLYPTWQEAGKAAKALGITGWEGENGYESKYKLDPRLPSSPRKFYSDFPGIIKFLSPGIYATLEEASDAVAKLGIKNRLEYVEKHAQDPRLPRFPARCYPDFPDWDLFLANARYYLNWKTAAAAAKKLNIINSELDYYENAFLDKKLPPHPDKHYRDFPGWHIFLSQYYDNWKEASEATKKLNNIKSEEDYHKKAFSDKKLPPNPDKFYKDFPGWKVFLTNYYVTWQKASVAAKALGIMTGAEYYAKYTLDPKLPPNLGSFYKDFPGWKKFLS